MRFKSEILKGFDFQPSTLLDQKMQENAFETFCKMGQAGFAFNCSLSQEVYVVTLCLQFQTLFSKASLSVEYSYSEVYKYLAQNIFAYTCSEIALYWSTVL